MNILIFNTFYYPKFVGGAEISVQLLAEGLKRSGHNVFVITTGKSFSIARVNGVVVIYIKQRNVYSSYNGWERPSLLKSVWHLIDSCNVLNYFLISGLLRKIRPDVVHTNNIQGFSPFIWAVIKRKQLPIVHTFRDYYLICHKANRFNNGKKCEGLCAACRTTYSIKRNFAHYPDCYVGISRFILEKHKEYIPMTGQLTDVIHNSVSIPEWLPLRRQPREKVVLGFIGRISPDKGAGYFADQLGKIRSDLRTGFKVVFAGKGDEAYLGELEKKLDGIHFEFSGVVHSASFYRQVDITIVPSLWDEPFGRTVIESLSYGVPVCLAESGGLSELYNPECTWSFNPRANNLQLLLEYIIENKQEIETKSRFCGEHANRFSEDSTLQRYLTIYSMLTKQQADAIPPAKPVIADTGY